MTFGLSLIIINYTVVPPVVQLSLVVQFKGPDPHSLLKRLKIFDNKV